jgi:hypothetical protein
MPSDIKVPTAVWSGTFRVFGIDLKCHVLDTGQRIIDAESFQQFMDALADGQPVTDDEDLMAFLRWQKRLS